MYLADGLARVVAFFRAGYPSGMPPTGYVPLVALLRRRVTDDEITSITSELMSRRRRPISNVDVGVRITRITDELPSADDIDRVRHRLEAIGYSCGRSG
jgi:Protein of unknown function (DUF3349)